MSSTRKNGQYYFGMKVHAGVDAKSGLAHSLVVTTAKDADIKIYPNYCMVKKKQFSEIKHIAVTEKSIMLGKQKYFGMFWTDANKDNSFWKDRRRKTVFYLESDARWNLSFV